MVCLGRSNKAKSFFTSDHHAHIFISLLRPATSVKALSRPPDEHGYNVRALGVEYGQGHQSRSSRDG